MEMVKIGKLYLAETQFNSIYTSWYVYTYMQIHTHAYIYKYTKHGLQSLTKNHLLNNTSLYQPHMYSTNFQN